MFTTRVFQNGNSQALRIPHEMRTDKKDFYIRKVGDMFIAYPVDDPWAPVRPLIGAFPQDFMADREQPAWDAAEEREELENVPPGHEHLHLFIRRKAVLSHGPDLPEIRENYLPRYASS